MSAITEPIPFRLLVDEAVKWTRRHFRAMYLPVAVPISIVNGLIPVAQALWFTSMFNPEASPGPAQMFVGMGAFLAVTLLAGVVWGLGYEALLQAATDAVQGQPMSMKHAWIFTIRPRVFGTSVLAGLCVVVGCVFCLLPGLFLGLLFSMLVPVMAAERLYGMDAITATRRANSTVATVSTERPSPVIRSRAGESRSPSASSTAPARLTR